MLTAKPANPDFTNCNVNPVTPPHHDTAMPRKNQHRYPLEKIRADFMSSGATLKELCKRHECTYRWITEHSAKGKWFEQRQAMEKEAREHATAALTKQIEAQAGELAKIQTKTSEQHMERSLQTGDRLYTLFQAAVTAMKEGDLRTMRSAIDAWVSLDNQMRKIDNIESSSDKPLVNINVLAALPSKSKGATVDVSN